MGQLGLRAGFRRNIARFHGRSSHPQRMDSMIPNRWHDVTHPHNGSRVNDEGPNSRDSEVGMLIGLYSLCEVIFSPLWGTFADKVGRKWGGSENAEGVGRCWFLAADTIVGCSEIAGVRTK